MRNQKHASARGGGSRPSVSVIVPSYRRPDSLMRCVRSLLAQAEPPEEILIAFRTDDDATAAVVRELAEKETATPIHAVRVEMPGHLPPVEAAAAAARSDIVVIVDDDITCPPDWLRTLSRHFADREVGVVGGRVIVPGHDAPRPRAKAGQLTWYGQHFGNIASVTEQGVREVTTVMECNWAWRRDLLVALEFDAIVNFDDASMYGLDLCLQARRKGFKVLYDPEAAAIHHLAPRDPTLDRSDRSRRFIAYCRNYTYIMLKHLTWPRKLAFLFWWFVIGERGAWGFASFAFERGIMRRRRDLPELGLILRAKVDGIRTWRTHHQASRRASRTTPGGAV